MQIDTQNTTPTADGAWLSAEACLALTAVAVRRAATAQGLAESDEAAAHLQQASDGLLWLKRSAFLQPHAAASCLLALASCAQELLRVAWDHQDEELAEEVAELLCRGAQMCQ